MRISDWSSDVCSSDLYDLASDMQLKSITAYRKLDSRFGADVGGDPSGAFQPTFGDDEKQFTQEIQLIGKGFDGRWKYVFGGYFFHESGRQDRKSTRLNSSH